MTEAKPNYRRVIISIIFTIIAIVALYLHWQFRKDMFFINGFDSTRPWMWLIYRLIWCCMWGWIGLTIKSWFMRDNKMNKKQLIVIITLILILSASGCRSIYVGGSGKVGDVNGSGGVNIPIPKLK